jgi:nitrite reductase (NO-forming)
VKVTLGRPSELGIVLSRYSRLPTGRITFEVTNRGKVAHDFRLCSMPVTTSAAIACQGRTTPLLQHGKHANLTVTINVDGKYEYLCTVPGHADAGMKGLLGVGVPVASPAAPASVAPASAGVSAAGASSASAAPSSTCTSPASTTVSVNEYDFGFKLSRLSVPCGTITFNMTNTGAAPHDFVIAGNSGAIIRTGQSATMTASLGPGLYRYLCDVNGHDALGMVGTLTVTG